MLLKDILATAGGLPEAALNTPVHVSYSDGGLVFTAPVAELMFTQEAQYLYDGEVISETELAGRLLVSQAKGEDPARPYQIYLPKNSLVICAKSKL